MRSFTDIKRRVRTGILCLAGLLVTLSGCQQQPVKQAAIEDKSIHEATTYEPDRYFVPDEVQQDLVPSMELYPGNEGFYVNDNERFDISVNDIPAEQFFLSLFDGTGYDIVLHPEVTGLVTLNLRDVTLNEVLKAVREVYGFDYTDTDYGYYILPGRLRARLYQVNYININDPETEYTPLGEFSESEITTAETSASRSLPPESFWDDLQQAIKSIVGSNEGRSVAINPHSGVVVVRALSTELEEVERYLQQTQLIVQRQVVLETQFLKVSPNNTNSSGINWDSILEPGSIAVKVHHSDDGSFSGALNMDDFASFVELLKKQGEVETLSSTRFATLNNQKAFIRSGNENYLVADNEIKSLFSGVTLDVIPHVSAEGDIILKINPAYSHVLQQSEDNHPMAVTRMYETESVVRAGNGQLIMVGGLSDKSSADELVVLLKPVIVDGYNEWSDAVLNSRSNLGELYDSGNRTRAEDFLDGLFDNENT